MAKARDLKRRIGSIENTRKITRTMEMVATSKLRKAQQRVLESRPYSAKLREVIGRLATLELAEVEPLLRQPEEIRRARVILLTSNRGLCGAFNTNLIRAAQEQTAELEAEDVDVDFHVFGKKGIGFFRFRGVEMSVQRTDLTDRPSLDDARSLIDESARQFVDGEIDAAYVVFAEFRNMVSTPPLVRQVLPVEVSGERRGREPFFIFDPAEAEILRTLLPLYVTNSAYNALLETSAAEQAARRTAMKNATDNADDYLFNLTRTYNRARQAEITQQIAEIMGGAEALKE
jgi:F-type H+-transporting ATPase subunit gamma